MRARWDIFFRTARTVKPIQKPPARFHFPCSIQKKSGENHASVEAPAAESVTVNVIEEVKDEKEETAAEVAGIKVPPLFR